CREKTRASATPIPAEAPVMTVIGLRLLISAHAIHAIGRPADAGRPIISEDQLTQASLGSRPSSERLAGSTPQKNTAIIWSTTSPIMSQTTPGRASFTIRYPTTKGETTAAARPNVLQMP